MLDSIDSQGNLSDEYRQVLSCQTICKDCAFHTVGHEAMECIHPEELEVNCSTVTFCNSFQPAQEIDSPCVSFGQDDVE